MAELGELSLWAALPLAAAGAVASASGGLRGRGDVAAFGGRAAEAAWVLVLLSIVGLAHALTTVQLKYAYVATVSGFQESWAWRLAGLWSAPVGGVLLVTLLIAGATALSYRLESSRQAAARTGVLAVLSLVGLLMVLARTRPFTLLPAPAPVGAGLPSALRDLSWHVEILAAYLAVTCGSFSFAGVIADQLVGTRNGRRHERAAMALAATLLAVAILAATWRAYARSGTLFDAEGFSYVLAYLPAWFLAHSSLHAPAGKFVPAWAARWRRILEFAFFPTVLGAWGAVLLGFGGPATPRLWVAGLAVGVISGALAGIHPRDEDIEQLRDVPGFGPWAFRGGLLALVLAGIAAVAGVSGGTRWADLAWALGFVGLAAAATWSTSRPAGRWRRVRPVAAALAIVSAVALYAVNGRQALVFAVAGALVAAIAVGAAADAVRVVNSQRRWRYPRLDERAEIGSLFRWRTGRRRASAAAHMGLALVALGIAAESLTRSEVGVLYPGEALSLDAGHDDPVRVTFLGLSRYHVRELQKQVASFRLERGPVGPELVTAEMQYDVATDLSHRIPAMQRGAVYDIVVSIAGLAPGEGIRCRLAVRPLSGLVWLGGLLLLLSGIARWRWIL